MNKHFPVMKITVATKDLSDVEAELSEKIIEMIVEDIFNRAFVNW